MKYKIHVEDKQMDIQSEIIVDVRKNTSLLTIVVKGITKHLENNPDSENEETLKLVNYLKRECTDSLEAFLEDLKDELDLNILIVDLNNHIYENLETNKRITSYDVGRESYYRAYLSQVNEEDGEKDFENYLPDFDIVVEHGNELMSDDIDSDNENWEIVEY